MTLGRDIFFDLVGLQRAMFFKDRLGRFFNLSHNLLTLAYIFVISHVDVLSALEYWILTNRSYPLYLIEKLGSYDNH